MKLEVGKSYKTISGEKVIIVFDKRKLISYATIYPFVALTNVGDLILYTEKGTLFDSYQDELDIISEWRESFRKEFVKEIMANPECDVGPTTTLEEFLGICCEINDQKRHNKIKICEINDQKRHDKVKIKVTVKMEEVEEFE